MRVLSFACSWWKRTSFDAMAANIRTGTLTSPKLIAPPQIGLGICLLASDGVVPGGVRAARRRSCLHVARVPHGSRGAFSGAHRREGPAHEPAPAATAEACP